MYHIKNKYIRREYINAEALLEFDGVDDMIDIGDFHSIRDTTDWAIEAIIKPEDITTDRTIFGDSALNGFRLYVKQSENAIVAGFSSNTDAAIVELSTDYVTDLIHIVVTHNQTTDTANLYVNGQLEDSNIIPFTYHVSQSFLIGTDNDSGTFFKGKIGLFRLYNGTSILSESEDDVLALLRNPYAIPYNLHSKVVAEYIFQGNYFKDNTNHYEKGADSILIFDSSGQYSYARPSGTFSTDYSVDPGYTILDPGWQINEGVLFYTNPSPNYERAQYQYAVGSASASSGQSVDFGFRARIRFDIVNAFNGTGVRFSGGTYRAFAATEYVKYTGAYEFDEPLTGGSIVNGCRFNFNIGADTTEGAIDNLSIHIYPVSREPSVMTGWSDEELGTDSAINRSAVYDFYDPGLEIQNPYGIALISAADHRINFPDFSEQISNTQATVFLEIDLTTALTGARLFSSALETDLSANTFTLLITSLFNLSGSDNAVQCILKRTLPSDALYTVNIANFRGRKLKILGSFDTVNTSHYLYILDEFGNFYNNALTTWPSGQNIRWDNPAFGRDETGGYQFDGIYKEARFINTVFSDTATAEAFLRNPSYHPDEVAVFGTLVESDQLLDESGNENHADISSISLGDGRRTANIPPIRQAFDGFTEDLSGFITAFGDVIGSADATLILTCKFTPPIPEQSQYIFGLTGLFQVNMPFAHQLRGDVIFTDPAGSGNIILFQDENFYSGVTHIVLRRNQGNYRSHQLGRYEIKIEGNYIFSDLSGVDLRLLHNIFPGFYIIRAGIWSRTLSDTEIAHLNGNEFPHNPHIAMMRNCECYYLFNRGDAFTDGTDLMLRDYSGNDRHITINGLSGAGAVEKQITFNNQLVSVDSLRSTQAAVLLTEDNRILAQEDNARIFV